jgi:hypothetical protein
VSGWGSARCCESAAWIWRASRSAGKVWGLKGSKAAVKGPRCESGRESVSGAACRSCLRAVGGSKILSPVSGILEWAATVKEADQVREGVPVSISDIIAGQKVAKTLRADGAVDREINISLTVVCNYGGTASDAALRFSKLHP